MKSRLLISLLICLFSINANAQNENKGSKQTEEKGSQAVVEQPQSAATENESNEAKIPAQVNDAVQPSAPEAQVLLPTPEAKAGYEKSKTCVACHNVDGNSTVPNWPKLAGQHESYLIKQLHDFRLGDKGTRNNPSMYSLVANLSDQDIAELAAFYSVQKPTMGKANATLVPLGEKIYRGGNIETGVTACSACHGPDGKGNGAAKFPSLAGQHSVYIEQQLHDFKDGKRKNSPSDMMTTISHKLSDEEIKAVSSFIEGLR